MSLTISHVGGAENGAGSLTSYATGSLSTTSGQLYVVWVATTSGAEMTTAPTCTFGGTGLTLTLRKTQKLGNNLTRALFCFTGLASASSSGTFTFTRGGTDTFNALQVSVETVAGSAGVPTYLQAVGDWKDTGVQPTVSITMGDGDALMAGMSRYEGTVTPRTDWTELYDDTLNATYNIQMETQYRVGTDTAASGTNSSTTAGVNIVCIEIDEVVSSVAPQMYYYRASH